MSHLSFTIKYRDKLRDISNFTPRTVKDFKCAFSSV